MKRNRVTGILLAVANGILLFLCAILYFGKDREGPELTFEAVQIVYREGMETKELLEGVSARDAKDGDISSRIVIEKISENREENTVVVFYAVSDMAGNVARASRVFTAVYTEQGEESVENRFLDAGIEAELKEGNIINSKTEDETAEKESENGDGDGREENEAEDIEERAAKSSASPPPAQSPAFAGRGQPSSAPAIGREAEPEPEDAGEPGSRPQETPQAGAEPEAVREPGVMPRDRQEPGAEPGAGVEARQEPETEPEPAAEPDQETGNTAAGQAPVLTLKASEVEVKAGQGPAWVDLIGTLSDDKDGYETLFGNLNVSRYDRDKPGSYQVSVFTQDSDGNRSEAVPLTIIVR